ncbi:MAG TPA: nuclear transport factor 2 family protein [Chloroflexota bacterium]|nr:nuclear transport factor 2 family protein [Chloroflexota bacterium]
MAEADYALLAQREAIRDLIQASGALLDQERFADWIALFAADGVYELASDSPELGQPSPWLDLDRASLAQYLAEMGERVRYRDRRLHLIATISVQIEGDTATAESHVVVFRTGPEGATHCDAAGRYHDTLVRQAGQWRLARRRVTLDTRVHPGHHVPL